MFGESGPKSFNPNNLPSNAFNIPNNNPFNQQLDKQIEKPVDTLISNPFIKPSNSSLNNQINNNPFNKQIDKQYDNPFNKQSAINPFNKQFEKQIDRQVDKHIDKHVNQPNITNIPLINQDKEFIPSFHSPVDRKQYNKQNDNYVDRSNDYTFNQLFYETYDKPINKSARQSNNQNNIANEAYNNSIDKPKDIQITKQEDKKSDQTLIDTSLLVDSSNPNTNRELELKEILKNKFKNKITLSDNRMNEPGITPIKLSETSKVSNLVNDVTNNIESSKNVVTVSQVNGNNNLHIPSVENYYDIGRFPDSSAVCVDMCPQVERIRRSEEYGALHELEKPDTTKGLTLQDTMIKRFQKSAADHELNVPSLVRTPRTLLKTIIYIEENLMQLMDDYLISSDNNSQIPAPIIVYLFIWDRFRMIAKDFTLMNPSQGYNRIWIECHERMARWYIYMDHRMKSEDDYMSAGHGQQNGESLNNIFKSLYGYYKSFNDVISIDSISNKGEFIGYFIIFQIGNKGEITKFLQQLSYDYFESIDVQFAIEVWRSIKSDNYIKFFRLLMNSSLLQACLMHRYVSEVRFTALKKMCKSYSAPSKPGLNSIPSIYPIDILTDQLLFENFEETINFVQHCGLEIEEINNELFVLFENQNLSTYLPLDKNNNTILPVANYMENGIESKRIIESESSSLGSQLEIDLQQEIKYIGIRDICRGLSTTSSIRFNDSECLSKQANILNKELNLLDKSFSNKPIENKIKKIDEIKSINRSNKLYNKKSNLIDKGNDSDEYILSDSMSDDDSIYIPKSKSKKTSEFNIIPDKKLDNNIFYSKLNNKDVDKTSDKKFDKEVGTIMTPFTIPSFNKADSVSINQPPIDNKLVNLNSKQESSSTISLSKPTSSNSFTVPSFTLSKANSLSLNQPIPSFMANTKENFKNDLKDNIFKQYGNSTDNQNVRNFDVKTDNDIFKIENKMDSKIITNINEEVLKEKQIQEDKEKQLVYERQLEMKRQQEIEFENKQKQIQIQLQLDKQKEIEKQREIERQKEIKANIELQKESMREQKLENTLLDYVSNKNKKLKTFYLSILIFYSNQCKHEIKQLSKKMLIIKLFHKWKYNYLRSQQKRKLFNNVFYTINFKPLDCVTNQKLVKLSVSKLNKEMNSNVIDKEISNYLTTINRSFIDIRNYIKQIGVNTSIENLNLIDIVSNQLITNQSNQVKRFKNISYQSLISLSTMNLTLKLGLISTHPIVSNNSLTKWNNKLNTITNFIRLLLTNQIDDNSNKNKDNRLDNYIDSNNYPLVGYWNDIANHRNISVAVIELSNQLISNADLSNHTSSSDLNIYLQGLQISILILPININKLNFNYLAIKKSIYISTLTNQPIILILTDEDNDTDKSIVKYVDIPIERIKSINQSNDLLFNQAVKTIDILQSIDKTFISKLNRLVYIGSRYLSSDLNNEQSSDSPNYVVTYSTCKNCLTDILSNLTINPLPLLQQLDPIEFVRTLIRNILENSVINTNNNVIDTLNELVNIISTMRNQIDSLYQSIQSSILPSIEFTIKHDSGFIIPNQLFDNNLISNYPIEYLSNYVDNKINNYLTIDWIQKNNNSYDSLNQFFDCLNSFFNHLINFNTKESAIDLNFESSINYIYNQLLNSTCKNQLLLLVIEKQLDFYISNNSKLNLIIQLPDKESDLIIYLSNYLSTNKSNFESNHLSNQVTSISNKRRLIESTVIMKKVKNDLIVSDIDSHSENQLVQIDSSTINNKIDSYINQYEAVLSSNQDLSSKVSEMLNQLNEEKYYFNLINNFNLRQA